MELDISLMDGNPITSPIDAAVQELDMLLGTENTELIGDPHFGVNMEQFLWQMTPSPNEVASYIQDKIIRNTFWCNKLNVSIDVDVVEGTIRNIYEVKISLTVPGNTTSTRRTYQFK